MIGNISNPFSTLNPGGVLDSPGSQGEGLVLVLTALMRTAIAVAGIFTLINFILAGYTFLSSGGDPKKVQQAWEKIYISLIGLLVAAGSLLLAALIGWIMFGNPSQLIQIRIFTPGP